MEAASSYRPRESSCKISAYFIEKWLRYRLFRVCVVVVDEFQCIREGFQKYIYIGILDNGLID